MTNTFAGWGGPLQHAPEGQGREPQPVTTASSPVGDSIAAQANNHIEGVNTVFKRYAAEIAATQGQYDEATVRQRLADFQNTEAFQGIDPHIANVDQNVEAVEAKRANVKASLSPAGDAAEEERNTRELGATVRTLDSKEGVAEISAAAIAALESAPESVRGVLIEQLPRYLESRGVPATVIDRTVAKIAPDLAAVDAELAQAKKEQQVVRYNGQTVKRAIESGHAATTVVPL